MVLYLHTLIDWLIDWSARLSCNKNSLNEADILATQFPPATWQVTILVLSVRTCRVWERLPPLYLSIYYARLCVSTHVVYLFPDTLVSRINLHDTIARVRGRICRTRSYSFVPWTNNLVSTVIKTWWDSTKLSCILA